MTPAALAFLCDVDNTLLDNDRFEADLHSCLLARPGRDADAYWHAFEVRRGRLGYADYLGALQDVFDGSGRDACWLDVGHFLLDYPFSKRLFPDALTVLAQLGAVGPVWLISDGDAVMQPHKLRRARLWDAVAGRVGIFIHKETVLDRIERLCPAAHYVLIDDKPRILARIKAQWRDRVTTIMPLQGHYAREYRPDNGQTMQSPPPDLIVPCIGDLKGDPYLSSLIAGKASRPVTGATPENTGGVS